jgi:hypothetical protein
MAAVWTVSAIFDVMSVFQQTIRPHGAAGSPEVQVCVWVVQSDAHFRPLKMRFRLISAFFDP